MNSILLTLGALTLGGSAAVLLLACDEDALRDLPPESYAAYGQAILTAVGRLQNQEG